jgi:hypothetical protein
MAARTVSSSSKKTTPTTPTARTKLRASEHAERVGDARDKKIANAREACTCICTCGAGDGHAVPFGPLAEETPRPISSSRLLFRGFADEFKDKTSIDEAFAVSARMKAAPSTKIGKGKKHKLAPFLVTERGELLRAERGGRLAFYSWKKNVPLFDLSADVGTPEHHAFDANAFAVSKDGEYAVACTRTSSIVIFGPGGEEVWHSPKDELLQHIECIKFFDDGSLVCANKVCVMWVSLERGITAAYGFDTPKHLLGDGSVTIAIDDAAPHHVFVCNPHTHNVLWFGKKGELLGNPGLGPTAAVIEVHRGRLITSIVQGGVQCGAPGGTNVITVYRKDKGIWVFDHQDFYAECASSPELTCYFLDKRNNRLWRIYRTPSGDCKLKFESL